MVRFTNLALAAATSLGIALAPVPAAAAPDGDDIAATIAGIAILGLIANSANDRDKRRSTTTRSSSRVQSRDVLRNRVIDGEFRRHDDDRYDRHSGKHRGYKKAALPQRCARYLDTARGTRLVYTSHCLNRRYKHANKLPQYCERRVRTDRGIRTVYSARCLSRDGWRVARR